MKDCRRFERVWCIGFPRMGTTSLCSALRDLGYRVIHNPRTLADFHRCDAAADIKAMLCFRFLHALWPNSGFILNTRPFTPWFRSLISQGFFWNPVTNKPSPFVKGANHDAIVDSWTRVFGTVYPDPEIVRRSYDRHHADVRELFANKPDQLLTFKIQTHGWSELCQFLEMPIPNKPFPRHNKGRLGDDVSLHLTAKDVQ